MLNTYQCFFPQENRKAFDLQHFEFCHSPHQLARKIENLVDMKPKVLHVLQVLETSTLDLRYVVFIEVTTKRYLESIISIGICCVSVQQLHGLSTDQMMELDIQGGEVEQSIEYSIVK